MSKGPRGDLIQAGDSQKTPKEVPFRLSSDGVAEQGGRILGREDSMRGAWLDRDLKQQEEKGGRGAGAHSRRGDTRDEAGRWRRQVHCTGPDGAMTALEP